jgi:hypothetical protein
MLGEVADDGPFDAVQPIVTGIVQMLYKDDIDLSALHRLHEVDEADPTQEGG